ncbi:UNVERIFIED_CONTAM: hypothetical protein K2H54_039239 [Gekko kuhli]
MVTRASQAQGPSVRSKDIRCTPTVTGRLQSCPPGHCSNRSYPWRFSTGLLGVEPGGGAHPGAQERALGRPQRRGRCWGVATEALVWLPAAGHEALGRVAVVAKREVLGRPATSAAAAPQVWAQPEEVLGRLTPAPTRTFAQGATVAAEALGCPLAEPTQALGWAAAAAMAATMAAAQAQAQALAPEEEALGCPAAVPTQTLGQAATVEMR